MTNNYTEIKNNMCCIIIPLYKNKIQKEEAASLKQCCSVLKKYPIIFITHNKLDCATYTDICRNNNVSFKYEFFNEKYFCNIRGYNALLLSKQFYRRFNNYKYMLIYQLDAYVFRDELEYWCSQDYDYIGAPWLSIKSIAETPVFGSRYNLEVGNGGFCLRKTESFVDLYSSEIRLMHIFFEICILFILIKEKSKKNIFFKFLRCILFPLKMIIDKIEDRTRDKKNEDVLWVRTLQHRGKIPATHIASRFSFEGYCDYLFEISNHELPFGCHGWSEYYRWQLFWKKFIKL